MKTEMKISKEEFEIYLIERIKSRVEYETEREDAGNNYAHMLRGGNWAYYNKDERLKEWLKDNKIETTQDQFDTLVEHCLDWSEIESGHIFSNGTTPDRFICAVFGVGEVEEQISFEDFEREYEGTTKEEFKSLSKWASEDSREVCAKYSSDCLYLYEDTDCTWEFVLNKSQIKAIIEE